MRAVGTDSVGVLRWGLRRYILLLLACLLLGAVLAPRWAESRKPPVDATAVVITQRLDMDLTALPRYGEAVFNNGQVSQAVAAQFRGSGDNSGVIPDRVTLVTEQDSIVFQVVGHDASPKTAADIANTAAATFVTALNGPGVGVGAFELLQPASPPAARGTGLTNAIAIAIGTVAGLILGLALVSALLVARRPVVGSADAEEATGVPSLGTVSIPRTGRGRVAQPADFAGIVPVCRRLLGLPTPTVVVVSRPRDERLRRRLAVALASVMGRVRDVRFVSPSEALAEGPWFGSASGNGTGNDTGWRGRHESAEAQGRPAPVTLVESSEPLDLVHPPALTATVLVVREGIGSAALRSAVVEHLGGSAEARLLLVRRGRWVRGEPLPEADPQADGREPVTAGDAV